MIENYYTGLSFFLQQYCLDQPTYQKWSLAIPDMKFKFADHISNVSKQNLAATETVFIDSTKRVASHYKQDLC